jgi:integrase
MASFKGDFERMARRRYQKGSLIERNGMWIGLWRETVLEDGKPKRKLVWHPLGSRKEYPTERLALRALEQAVTEAGINLITYRPKPIAKFSQFAESWQRKVLPNLKPSTQPPIRSQLRRHIVPLLGDVVLKDITEETLQTFVTTCLAEPRQCSPKTIKNLIATMRIMWNSAKVWGYVGHDPFGGLVLPDWDCPDQPMFSPENVERIIAAVNQHYHPAFWLVVQTGIRRGELCALNVDSVQLDTCCITVRRSRSGKHITNTKAKRPRSFEISVGLRDCLRRLSEGRKPDDPLFVTESGVRLHPDNFVKRVLKPVVDALGLKGALHAFRHGNATAMDQLHVPMATRQARLGHVDDETTMGYTHLNDDGHRVAEALDQYFRFSDPMTAEPSGRVM